jgi:hypothetical protein
MEYDDQNRIDAYIHKMPVKTSEYLLPSVVGPINLETFESEGRSPTTIQFDRGKLTHLLNIPNTVRILKADNNAIDNLPQDGVRHLKILSCNNNNLTQFDASNFTDLEELYLNNNKLIELSGLPKKLKILEINNNPDLAFLDLGNAPDLKKISCTGNDNLHTIENVCQADNAGFIFKHDPDVEVKYVEKCSTKMVKKTNEETTLDHYYSLKHLYEINYKKDLHANLPKHTATIKTKRNIVRKIPRKCVNCGKSGGTKFWRKDDTLYAECAATPKCDLNLKVSAGFYSNVRDLIHITQEDMQEKRANIIRMKMDTLFNYMTETESAKKFKQDLEMYQGDEAMCNTYIDYEQNVVSDPVRERLIKKKTQEIYRILRDVRTILEEYNKTGNKQLLKDAVDKQCTELHPEIEMLRNLKYPVMEMVENTSMKILKQMQYKPEMLDYNILRGGK